MSVHIGIYTVTTYGVIHDYVDTHSHVTRCVRVDVPWAQKRTQTLRPHRLDSIKHTVADVVWSVALYILSTVFD